MVDNGVVFIVLLFYKWMEKGFFNLFVFLVIF